MAVPCGCPASVLDTVPYNPCFKNFGKDGRWAFQILDDTNNTFVNGTNGIEEEGSWSPLTVAVNDTKVVVTPLLEEVNFPAPGKLERSENLDGAPISVASEPQLVTAVMSNITPAQYDALRNLKCRDRELSFYRIDNNSQIGARLIGSNHAGIRISPRTFQVLSPSKGPGRGDELLVQIEFYLADGWYSDFDVVTPETGFDPLTEIRP